jgi:hypothetical protein
MRVMRIAGLIVLALGLCVGLALSSPPQASQPQSSTGAAKQLGTIKSITGSTIVLATDNGAPVTVQVEGTARIVRIAPGDKDLKNAAPISLHDLQAGDRILVRGNQGESGQLTASAIIAMKLSDLETKQQRERDDWQKRGVAGLVSAVDTATGTVNISASSPAGKKTVAIHTNKDTVLRRYAPDSVRFDDAQPGTLAQIKPGDQLRARGTRGTDGNDFSAEEIVTGAFRNIAGNVASVDASSGMITVLDSATKKPITVKLTADSQLRNLPAEMAKRMAMRLAGVAGPGAGGQGAAGTGAAGQNQASAPNGGFRREGISEPREGAGAGPPRRGDIQQLFNRLPPLSVGEMQKGDTVMLVATEGTSSGAVTAIKLLDGVEPLLAAAPKNGGEMTLSPWSLGGGDGGEDAN